MPSWFFSPIHSYTTDTSSIAVGGVLSQIREDGNDHPIPFFSKALQKAERKWDSCEQQLFANLCSVQHFRHYLLNTKFRARTDNKACTYVFKNPSWALRFLDGQSNLRTTTAKSNIRRESTIVWRMHCPEPNLLLQYTWKLSPTPILMKGPSTKRWLLLGSIKKYLEKESFPNNMSRRTHNQVGIKSELFRLINSVLYKTKILSAFLPFRALKEGPYSSLHTNRSCCYIRV